MVVFAWGFTLIELMVTVVMVATVLTVGVPAFKDSIRNAVLTSSINDFIASLNYARSESVKRGVRVAVRKKSTSDSIGWESGWQVFTDLNSNNVYDSATEELLRSHDPLRSNYTLRGNNNFKNFIAYRPSGESTNIGAFVLCDSSVKAPPTKSTSRLITVSLLGRISLGTDSDNDGVLEKTSSSGTKENITSCLLDDD